MSKIVGPFEPTPIPEDFKAPEGASWWRFRLRENDEGFLYVVECDAERTWITWEFFDGESTLIDCGLDRPTLARLHEFESAIGGCIDVLHVGRPTPSLDWACLTEPGNHVHPNDYPGGVLLPPETRDALR